MRGDSPNRRAVGNRSGIQVWLAFAHVADQAILGLRDMHSTAQRNHDGLKAMGRSVLASGELGQHNGLPCTIVVSTTLKELESGCGQAVTGGGSLLPMSAVIRMASPSHHYLVIYQDHTGVPLYLGRTKRLASPGQRIVLYACAWPCGLPPSHGLVGRPFCESASSDLRPG